MKVLLISALYPPKLIGGAEDSARNLAEWLVRQGVEVAVIRATDTDESEGEEVNEAGVRVYRVRTSHLYAPFRFLTAPAWKKPLWHLQDHFAPAIVKRVGAILDAFAPDLVNVHMIQGIGYPALRAVAKRRTPVSYVLHDLGLACVRMNMFKRGKNCTRQCTMCKASTWYKTGLVRSLDRVDFISPSRANLDTLSRYFPVNDYSNTVLLNANAYPEPTRPRSDSRTLRLLYAGRIHSSKGVDMLLHAVEGLAPDHDVTIRVAGAGPQEDELKQRFGDRSWCTFLGFIPQQQLSDEMMDSDLLCIPSIWAENSPGVVIQALGVGLPVIGSDRGGIPELVADGVNGRLVHEQTVDSWADALGKIARGEEPLESWRHNATLGAHAFTQDGIGTQVLARMKHLASHESLRSEQSGASPSP
jgi:glycosyltransferase involved in cell wall biosynthesis